jgi:hypothetical protein
LKLYDIPETPLYWYIIAPAFQYLIRKESEITFGDQFTIADVFVTEEIFNRRGVMQEAGFVNVVKLFIMLYVLCIPRQMVLISKL